MRTLQLDREGAVATVTLHRPEALNALNAAMFDELEQVFTRLADDRAIRVILVTGSGERAFAAGADIRELIPATAAAGKALSQRGQGVFALIEGCAKPVIACINGVALGGGCELALACTLRITSDGAMLGLPEVKLGLIPGYGGTQRLVRLIGRSAALEMMLTGRTVSADEALRTGLVDQAVPAGGLMSTARALAETISRRAPLAVAGVIEAVRRGASSRGADQAFAAETEIFARLCGTADKQEGLTAFLEKRSPAWKGE